MEADRVSGAEFEWPVSKSGYSLREIDDGTAGNTSAERGASVFITDGYPTELSKANTRLQKPLSENPALFHNFAWLEGEEAIISFANSHGLLGNEITETFKLFPQEGRGKPILVFGERLDAWELEILKLRHAINLWKTMKTSESKALTDYIKGASSSQYPIISSKENPDKKPDRSVEELELELILQRENDYYIAASFIRNEVTKHLDGHLKVQAGALGEVVRLEPFLYFLPDSLLSSMWEQFALAFDAGKQYGQCKICNDWFEFKEAGQRQARYYCGNSCRLRAYRKRQEEARRMREAGMSLRDIAKKLGTSSSTVKGWVAKK